MAGDKEAARWTATVTRAVVVLVGVAIGARVIFWLLAPLVPILLTLLGLGLVVAVLRGWLR